MIEVYIDGASAGDPGPSGAGIFIKHNGTTEQHAIPLGIMSNHEAEFHSFIIALKLCLEKGDGILSIRTDSQLVNQAIEKMFIKNKRFITLFDEASLLMKEFDHIFVKWIPGHQNKIADVLARKAIALNN